MPISIHRLYLSFCFLTLLSACVTQKDQPVPDSLSTHEPAFAQKRSIAETLKARTDLTIAAHAELYSQLTQEAPALSLSQI